MFLLFKTKSRAQKVQERIEKGYQPSSIALTVSEGMNAKKHNKLISNAIKVYNKEHKSGKVFVE